MGCTKVIHGQWQITLLQPKLFTHHFNQNLMLNNIWQKTGIWKLVVFDLYTVFHVWGRDFSSSIVMVSKNFNICYNKVSCIILRKIACWKTFENILYLKFSISLIMHVFFVVVVTVFLIVTISIFHPPLQEFTFPWL